MDSRIIKHQSSDVKKTYGSFSKNYAIHNM